MPTNDASIIPPNTGVANIAPGELRSTGSHD